MILEVGIERDGARFHQSIILPFLISVGHWN